MNVRVRGSHRWALVVVGALSVVSSPVLLDQTAQAAASSVSINELMYNPVSDNDGDEFLELANSSATAVDLSGWCFTAGITLCFPTGTSIAGNGYLVIGENATRFQTTYGFAPAAVYSGKLSNSGEKVTLVDSAATVMDTVTYSDHDPWPTTPDGTGASLELVDPAQDHNDPLNWVGSTAASGNTIRAHNSVTRTGLVPRISAVSAAPQVPAANQAVTVTATVTGQSGAVTLFYRSDFGAEQSTPMTSTGGDGYSASIPGVAAGHLIRYRVQADNASGTGRYPRADDTITYQGVVAADGITSAIPELQWFIADADYSAITGNPTADIERPAVLAYGGAVIDNVTASLHGAVSRTAPKPNWQFKTPQGHDLAMPGVLADPVDNFLMQAEWSDHSYGRSLLSWDAYRKAGVVDTQSFPIRTQRNGSFMGLYKYQDNFDGTWRDRNGLSDDQLFKAEHSAFAANRALSYRYTKKNPDDGDFSGLGTFLAGLGLTGTSQRNFLLANANIPEMVNYAAVDAIIRAVDQSDHNFYFGQDPVSGRWSIIPWDLDHTWGNDCCSVQSTFVTPDEPGDPPSVLLHAILSQPDWRQMYFRRLRTLVGQILATGVPEGVYDSAFSPAQPTASLDFNAWPTQPWMAYSQQRTALFSAIQSRRNVFAADSRLPGAQTANPNVVINELQPSPTAGDDGEFIELYNPSATEAVDLSGWTFSSAVDLTIPPGTVILPHGFVVFNSNDTVFRTTYGGTIFDGGTYSGHLSTAETLTLTRADGSVDDSVAYGGTGWPQPTTGQSLELLDPSSDHNNGASWALSQAPAGTPGSANQQSTTQTAPGAPTIGTATAGSSSATVTWTAPGSDGGSPITGYKVRVVDAGTNQQVGALLDAPASATSLMVNGLTNGTSYAFQVAAVNVIGTGSMSALSNVVTPQAVQTSVSYVGGAHSADGAKKFKSLTVPAATQVGDTLVMVVTEGTNDGWSSMSGVTGWTQVSSVSGSSKTSTVWVKQATASDLGKTVTITNAAYRKALLGLGVYRGLDATSPVRAATSATDTSRSSHTSPTATATAGDWVFSYYVDFSSSTTAWGAPAGTSLRDSSTQTGSGRYASLWVDSGASVPGGAYGGLVATTNAASTRAFMWTVDLRPAS
jgi:CotH kinase protein/Lamin Tail Domain/Fibronectin type III domain